MSALVPSSDTITRPPPRFWLRLRSHSSARKCFIAASRNAKLALLAIYVREIVLCDQADEELLGKILGLVGIVVATGT